MVRCWPGAEPIGGRKVRRDVEGDRDRVRGQALHRGHPQGSGTPPDAAGPRASSAIGTRSRRAPGPAAPRSATGAGWRPSDRLHVLEGLPARPAGVQRLAGGGGEAGRLARVRRAALRAADGRASTRQGRPRPAPAARCRRRRACGRPSALSQSVVHAGESTVRTSTSATPPAASAATTSARMVSTAGQPEYVGVIVTMTRPSSTRTSRRIPRSSIVSTGSSGSGTAATSARRSASPPLSAGHHCAPG